jgi:hypothetical protein
MRPFAVVFALVSGQRRERQQMAIGPVHMIALIGLGIDGEAGMEPGATAGGPRRRGRAGRGRA